MTEIKGVQRAFSQGARSASVQVNKEKLEMQISRNLDDNINRLIDIKRKLESETNPGIIKVLKKYEKRLTKAIGMSSSSKNDSD